MPKITDNKWFGTPTFKLRVRCTLAALSVLVVFYIALPTIYWYLRTFVYVNEASPPVIPTRPYNELVQGAIQGKLYLSNNLFQVGLLVTAAVAGLLIAKDGEAGFVLTWKRKNFPEIIMFTCTSTLLLLSLILNGLYLREVSYIYSLSGSKGIYNPATPLMADIFNDNVNFLFINQLWCLIGGGALAFATFLSAHKLKEKRP
jgi:hypothetical protein